VPGFTTTAFAGATPAISPAPEAPALEDDPALDPDPEEDEPAVDPAPEGTDPVDPDPLPGLVAAPEAPALDDERDPELLPVRVLGAVPGPEDDAPEGPAPDPDPAFAPELGLPEVDPEEGPDPVPDGDPPGSSEPLEPHATATRVGPRTKTIVKRARMGQSLFLSGLVPLGTRVEFATAGKPTQFHPRPAERQRLRGICPLWLDAVAFAPSHGVHGVGCADRVGLRGAIGSHRRRRHPRRHRRSGHPSTSR